MPQNVPVFSFSENALRLRQFAYEQWCANGVGPTLLDVHQALGLSRREIQAGYKELQLGTICVVDQDSLNANLLKLQPFSAFPSQVKTFVDGEFHSFAGCAMESIAFSKMPPFAGKDVRVESYCACCFEPVSFVSREMEMRDLSHEGLRIHVSLSPYDWNNNDILRMCDSMNFAIDPDHAERFERQIGRRGVLFTIEQAENFVRSTADSRMHDEHWGVVPVIPSIIVDFAKALGVDTSPWET
jgi:hypothetical protein